MTAATEIQPYQRPSSFGQAPARAGTAASQATAIEQQRAIAEVQASVVVAQSCPRDMAAAEAEMEYVCGRLDMAEHAFYQVDNRGTGPSVHLMRELARIWGNVDYGVKELHRDDDKGISEVQAFSWDIQKNTRSSRTFINPHARMKGRGAARERVQLVDLTDIYLSNQNVGARAVRECISTILPRWFTEKAQEICRRTLEHGEGEPLQDRINTMISWFGQMGVSVAQLEARVGRPQGTWDARDVAQFKIAGKSINAGEARVEDLFPPAAESSTSDAASEIAPAPEPAAEKPKTTRKPRSAAKTEQDNTDADSGEATQVAQQQETRDGGGDTNEVEKQVENTTAAPAPGAEPPTDSGDTAADLPTPGKPQTAKRKALESRMFQLISAARPKVSDDDRIDLYRAILGRPEVTTTDHLTDDEVEQVSNTLYGWMKDAELDTKVRDIIMAADARAAAEAEGAEK